MQKHNHDDIHIHQILKKNWQHIAQDRLNEIHRYHKREKWFWLLGSTAIMIASMIGFLIGKVL